MPFPGPHSVLLDNTWIHHSQEVTDLVHSYGMYTFVNTSSSTEHVNRVLSWVLATLLTRLPTNWAGVFSNKVSSLKLWAVLLYQGCSLLWVISCMWENYARDDLGLFPSHWICIINKWVVFYKWLVFYNNYKHVTIEQYVSNVSEHHKQGVKTQMLQLWGMGRVLGSGVSECRVYKCRGQRHGLNLCVSPSLPELECLCISEGRSKVKGSE